LIHVYHLDHMSLDHSLEAILTKLVLFIPNHSLLDFVSHQLLFLAL